MISANGGLPAHRYTPQVTPRWPRGSEPASLAHVPSFRQNPRGSPDVLAYPVPKACMHVLGTGVPRRLGVARSASSLKAAQALGCSLTPGLWISFGRATCMARAASVPGLWRLGFLTVVWHLCLGLRCACAPPLLAGLCGVGVCAWAPVSAAPCHSWLGCCGRFVLVCPLRLYPATPGWGVGCGCVCLGSGFGCAKPLLAGVLGCVCLDSGFGCAPSLLSGVLVCVCARVPAPLVPRHSWPGCAALMSVLGFGYPLRPADPGWGIRVCVCLSARSACTSPFLAGLCGVCVCAWARVSAAPRHSWLGCWGVCVFVCALRLYHANPGSGVRCGCGFLGSGFGCPPPLLAGVLGCMCACVCALLVPLHSWLACAVWVCVLGLGF